MWKLRSEEEPVLRSLARINELLNLIVFLQLFYCMYNCAHPLLYNSPLPGLSCDLPGAMQAQGHPDMHAGGAGGLQAGGAHTI